MSQSVTIELPDGLVQQMQVSTGSASVPLQKLMADVLTTFLESLRSLQSTDASIRAKAVEALGHLRTEVTIPLLEKALRDSDLTVQRNAVEALQKIGSREALDILEKSSSVQFDIDTSTFYFDPITPLIGTLDSEVSDVSENHDLYLTEILAQELQPSE